MAEGRWQKKESVNLKLDIRNSTIWKKDWKNKRTKPQDIIKKPNMHVIRVMFRKRREKEEEETTLLNNSQNLLKHG